MSLVSVRSPWSELRSTAGLPRWIFATLALSCLLWLVGLAGLLALAKHVHDDVPASLAIKLPALATHPTFIFGGESRTEYQIDPVLAARLIGKPQGAVVNLGYDAGEPLALLAAMHREPGAFADAHTVVSVAPFLFNEGVKPAALYPMDVLARLGVVEQMESFLPLRIGTLIRFVREAFAARLAADQDVADRAPAPKAFGLQVIDRNRPDDQWPASIGAHQHYTNWDLSGPKAKFGLAALCDMTKLTRKLTVVIPPWAPRYDRASDPIWRARDEQYVNLIMDTGRRCGFRVINIQSIAGLEQRHYADELHVNDQGLPIYTSYIMARLSE
jgi:hypothetical protein